MEIETISVRRFKAGYEIRKEIVSMDGCKPFERKSAYTPDGVYIGTSRWAHRLCVARGIVPQKRADDSNVCSIGFCEREQKWYGWSHRAMFGFGVGSTVVRGDCGYRAATPEELKAEITTPDEGGWSWMKPAEVEIVDGGVRLNHKMMNHTTEDPVTGELGGWVPAPDSVQTIECGRGEWTAETLTEAKRMACDFAEGVS